MSYLEECIEVGIRKGLDVSHLIREDWDKEQLLQVLWGLERALDVSLYAKKEFGWRQMASIKWRIFGKRFRCQGLC